MNFKRLSLTIVHVTLFFNISSIALAETYSVTTKVLSVAQDHSGISHIQLDNGLCPGDNQNYFYWKIGQGPFTAITKETSAAWVSLSLSAMLSGKNVLVISDYQTSSQCQIYHVRIVN